MTAKQTLNGSDPATPNATAGTDADKAGATKTPATEKTESNTESPKKGGMSMFSILCIVGVLAAILVALVYVIKVSKN